MRQLFAVAASIIAVAFAPGWAQGQDPARPNVFIIFFDWDKPDLRNDDVPTLDQVAAAWKQKKPGARLLISGHTDRSGGSSFNRRAGLKRAEAVRNQLAARGVPPAAMSIVSHGEEQPLVPTEDGVREVQNRRVEISFRE
jgi:OOP family OmpA-OmpF porin